MIAGVADTHTAIWYLFNDVRLSFAAGDFIDRAAAAGSRIVISSISLAEIVYLIEKNRVPANAYPDLKAALADPDHVFKEAPFTVEIVDAMRQVLRTEVPICQTALWRRRACISACRSSAGTVASALPTCKRSGSPPTSSSP
jgi:PIN domain nuclease of toxin-antitoxin system